jgi:hypothetical protein
MSLSIQYESVADASMRLQGTVVLYDGQPVYIENVTQLDAGDNKADVFRIYHRALPYGNSPQERKFISSKKYDLAPFPMGFMNKDGVTYYCSRLPRKQQRQGLSNGTFSCVDVSGRGGRYALEEAINFKEFADCIAGKYPSVAEATRRVRDGEQAVAFSRCFALVRDNDLPELIYLYHKQAKVGFVMDGKLSLAKKGQCLKESLREAGVEC